MAAIFRGPTRNHPRRDKLGRKIAIGAGRGDGQAKPRRKGKGEGQIRQRRWQFVLCHGDVMRHLPIKNNSHSGELV
jgi:hypothetical protein